MSFIEVEGIKVQLEKKRIKNFNLKVIAPYGEVKLSYPHRVKKQDCYHFVQSKISWIKKQQMKFYNLKVPEPLMYTTGEKVFFMGEEKEIYIEISTKRFVELKESRLYLFVLKSDTKIEKEQLLNEYYRKELYKVLFPLVKKWEPIMQVSVKETRIKNMKTLWGSCNIKAARIWLNLKLAEYDIKCIEYVVVHEMVHLLERLHSKRFYRLMDEFLPNWLETQNKLNQKID